MTTTISDPVYQGEGKWFTFTVTDEAGVPLDLSPSTFKFQVKASVDSAVLLFEAVHWDYTDLALGIVRANLPASQTLLMAPGTYYGQLLIVLVADKDVDISQIIKFKIKKPLVG